LHLLGCLPAALLAAAEASLAERTAHRPRMLEMVWPGPEAVSSRARDTRVVVSELFSSASKSVLVAGFRFDHSDRILAPLHTAMRDRGVRATFFIDAPQAVAVQQLREWFLREHWPFGEPSPEIYVDVRAGTGAFASLHAKCVVIDGRFTLITSATSQAEAKSATLNSEY
jgi:phosphatidylserine/phosphatidylglycerophosphate/cardiolipin synthase-like enzyme